MLGNLAVTKKEIHRKTAEPLSKKIVKGGLWVFALRLMNRGLGFVRTIILARLLAPEDFGLFGIAMLAIATLETFSQTGFQQALIQKRGNIESYLDTAWTVSAIRGTLLFAILFFSAPTIARFFNTPQASLVIRVIAITTLFTGFRNIGIVFFQKELEFNKQVLYEFPVTLVDMMASMSLAFIFRNAWALVWGGLGASLVKLFMSFIVHPYRPRMNLAREKFRDLLGFGKWIVGSNMLIFLITQGDDIFVGKILGATALGFYQVAYTLSNLPATEFTHVISQITYPAYSKIQDDLPKLRDAYLRVFQLTLFISIPVAAAIFLLAPEFINIFLGEKWMPIVPVMRILVFAGILRSIAATTGPIFHALGKPKVDTKWQIARFSVLFALVYSFTTKWGILGTAIAVLLSIFVTNLGFIFSVIKIVKCRTSSVIKFMMLPLVNAAIVLITAFPLKKAVHANEISGFIFVAASAVFIYIFITYIFDKFLKYNISTLIKTSIESLKTNN
jgi:O-antigen/teichoic acid export membrane protein